MSCCLECREADMDGVWQLDVLAAGLNSLL